MFFEFPGILITIGVILLLISIIIIIVAYKSDAKDVDASKLSTNYVHYDSEVRQEGYYDNGKPKIIIEDNSTTNKDQIEELGKTKIFKPAEIKLEEQKASEENNKEPRQMGIKDMLEDINKVDDKKENEKEEIMDIFNEEFEAINKEENKEDKVEKTLKEEKQETKETKNDTKEETKPTIEEDEDIELL